MSDISKDDFLAYESVRLSGVANIFDVTYVERLSGLSREQILDIMKNYAKYKSTYLDDNRDSNIKRLERAHRQGILIANHRDLVEIFGEPIDPPYVDNKSQVLQRVKTSHGVGAIYDWKKSKRYCGSSGLDPENIKVWHVGGYNKKTASDICTTYLLAMMTLEEKS